jgi:flagellar motor switch protein FliN
MKNETLTGDLEAISHRIDDLNATATATAPEAETHRPLTTIDAEIFNDVDVRLTAVLGHGTIAVRALLDLSNGSVIDLDTPLDGLVDLILNNHIVAQGEIVTVNDRFGIRITRTAVTRG